VLALLCLAVAVAAAAQAAAAPTASCRPTPEDAFGPFNRVAPPLRGKIGSGHVLTGVVLSAIGCKAIANAQVQFWQSNARGRYTRATSGTVVTDRAGRFRFEGPFPPSYDGREPHIHIRVIARGHRILLTRYEPRAGERRGAVRLVLVPDAL
jgi:protocatechuate 3,4-dioxygenase beta subunit